MSEEKHTPKPTRAEIFSRYSSDGWSGDAVAMDEMAFNEALNDLYGHECQQLDCDGICDSPENHVVNSLLLLLEVKEAMVNLLRYAFVPTLCGQDGKRFYVCKECRLDDEHTHDAKTPELVKHSEDCGISKAQDVLARIRAARGEKSTEHVHTKSCYQCGHDDCPCTGGFLHEIPMCDGVARGEKKI